MRSAIATLILAGAIGCAAEYGVRQALPPVTVPDGPPPLADDEHEDTWVQRVSPASDVLFVVDNSCSMRNEQAALGDNFEAFLEALLLTDTDFHIGVVSTDMVDPDHMGQLQASDGVRYLDVDTPNPPFHFGQMVDLGIDGDWTERGRSAAFTAVEAGLAEGWLREEASLHIVVVSDEDDATDDISREEFTEYLRGLKVAPFSVTFSSIVGPEGAALDPWAPCSAEYGLEYLEITWALGGLDLSICKRDWGPLLAELGSVAAGLRKEFFLTRRPIPKTIQVTIEVDGEPQEFEGPTSGFLYEARRNKVTLVNYLPPDGAVIKVRYREAN